MNRFFTRGLICNKKARKVCCPSGSDKSSEGCGNPLGQAQHALSGDGRSYSAPWAVSIGYYEDYEYQHECTGSIITDNIVITAAHCTHDNEDDLFIHAGVLNLRNLGSTERRIIQTIEHPNYNPPKVYFDVSIAVLEKFLSFDETIGPVCLPTETFDNSDFMNRFSITIQGWGKDNNGNFGQDLTKIDLTVRKNSFYNTKYEGISSARKEYWFPELLTSPMFCADSNLGANIGTCYGDSGGPSMIKDDEGVSYVLMGVVGGNPGECGKTQEYPDYFTFIGHQKILPWIQSTIKKASGSKERYPEMLSLSSTSMISPVHGIYKMDPNLNNDKPVWKHITQEYKIFYDDENYWTISLILNQKKPSSGDIKSVEKSLVYVPTKQWRSWDGSNWILEEDLIITIGEPKYPKNLTVKRWSSTEINFFEMVQEKVFNKRPVWKLDYTNDTEEFLYYSGMTWFIGRTIGASEGESVYGWDYSDDDTFWPNTNSLTILNYPENITLTSTGLFANLWFEYVGVYRKIPGWTRNGRPIWKRIDDGEGLDKDPKYFNYDENYYWSVLAGSTIAPFKNSMVQVQNKNFNYILTSAKQGSLHFIGSKWNFYKDLRKYDHDDDDSLIVTDEEPDYPPDIVTLSSKDPVSRKQFSDFVGIYERLPKVLNNGRPVWKRYGLGTRYIFYSGKLWAAWNDYKAQQASLKTSSPGLFSFLDATWQYVLPDLTWVEDKSLTISKGGPPYPEVLNIKDSSEDNDQFKHVVGFYKINTETYNDKPTWKNEKLGKHIFSQNEDSKTSFNISLNLESQWFAADAIGKMDNSSVKLYGWVHSGKSFIWPNVSTLYIANYPKMLTLRSEGATQELFPDVLGTYEMVPGLTNMRPRWKHVNRNIYLFYSAIYTWQFFEIGKDRRLQGKQSTEGKILFQNNGEWELNIYGNIYEDNTITIIEGEVE